MDYKRLLTTVEQTLAQIESAGTRLLHSRQVELQALTSEETKQALTTRGIQLISYADLQQL